MKKELNGLKCKGYFKTNRTIDHGDPDELMKEYEAISKELIATRDSLKKELMLALGDE
jgi:hypothetical protein